MDFWFSGSNRNFVCKAHDTRYSSKELAILYHWDFQTYGTKYNSNIAWSCEEVEDKFRMIWGTAAAAQQNKQSIRPVAVRFMGS